MAIDWETLGFQYLRTNSYIRYTHRNGSWNSGELVRSDHIQIPIAATALHYGQSAFEGLKAFSTKNNGVQLFRPAENAKRLRAAAERMHMAPVPEELFLEALRRLLADNHEFIPPYGFGASLYIRPLLFGSGPRIGIRSADEFTFVVLCMPVGNYYRSGVKAVDALIMDNFDRAAPLGLGHIKAAGNYVAGLEPSRIAAEQGFPICLYLDAKEHKYVDEFGTSNFVAVTKDNKYVTPDSKSILKSITNLSLRELAKAQGMVVEDRKIAVDELPNFSEVGACGTAVSLAPVRSIQYKDKRIEYSHGEGFGPKLKMLYEEYRRIQNGESEDRFDWLVSAT